jgi:hypothetical protein
MNNTSVKNIAQAVGVSVVSTIAIYGVIMVATVAVKGVKVGGKWAATTIKNKITEEIQVRKFRKEIEGALS